MTFFSQLALTDNNATYVTLTSDPVFGSYVTVQGHQRVNTNIVVGSIISDIYSEFAVSAVISGIASTCSAVITLQRQMRDMFGTDFWHDVETWSVTVAQGEGASSQNISDNPEPETVRYRIGIKTSDYQSGLALARIGSSG